MHVAHAMRSQKLFELAHASWMNLPMSETLTIDPDKLEEPARDLARGDINGAISALVGVITGAAFGPVAGGAASGVTSLGLARFAALDATERLKSEEQRLLKIDDAHAFLQRALFKSL